MFFLFARQFFSEKGGVFKFCFWGLARDDSLGGFKGAFEASSLCDALVAATGWTSQTAQFFPKHEQLIPHAVMSMAGRCLELVGHVGYLHEFHVR